MNETSSISSKTCTNLNRLQAKIDTLNVNFLSFAYISHVIVISINVTVKFYSI